MGKLGAVFERVFDHKLRPNLPNPWNGGVAFQYVPWAPKLSSEERMPTAYVTRALRSNFPKIGHWEGVRGEFSEKILHVGKPLERRSCPLTTDTI
jgi:hypothetical protein